MGESESRLRVRMYSRVNQLVTFSVLYHFRTYVQKKTKEFRRIKMNRHKREDLRVSSLIKV